MQQPDLPAHPDTAIAVIGMALRFPGAPDVAAFWDNLVRGVESISIGPAPEGHVAASGIVEDIERFDAAFFGYSPSEARELDPQQRMFLECAWAALESAGHAPQGVPIRAGVYGGARFSTYLLSNLVPTASARGANVLTGLLGFAADFLATRVAYKLGLTGPAVTVQTGCSTSLVAIHMACQALIAGECDLALAGGSRIAVPQLATYMYHEGGILSADGHCRAFDVHSTGTVPGNGAAVVVLKRLADALADGDPIHAVVLGSAINNDGAAKAGFAAPSVDGQASAIREALAVAGVQAADIGYVETHGTATPLGDPIEIAALTQVFEGVPPGSCGIGTVKTNIGHLDAAAGVAGFIKAVLALAHRTLPPSLHFTAPNPQLGLEASPFYVVAERRDWTSHGPRRAGVSAFGIGGTNAHVVLQEPPANARTAAPQRDELILLSARTQPALARMATALASALQSTEAPLADIAHTLQVGRARFAQRRYLVAREPGALADALVRDADTPTPDEPGAPDTRDAVFVFPGGGVQRVDMAATLRDEPGFRAAFADCAERAAGLLDVDLRRVVYPPPAQRDAMAHALDGPVLSQAAIFSCNWAIAQQWLCWGVAPRAVLGHSLGEYVAACLAGVFSLDDALRLVIARGRILERLPASGMVSVLAPPAELAPLLGGSLAIAAVNGPTSCVVAGARDEVAALETQLHAAGIELRRLRYARAAHTPLLDAYLADFERTVHGCALHAPNRRVVSSVTGTWLTAAQATDPAYWRRHFRDTVQFSAALSTLFASGHAAVIEVGPNATLSALIRQHPAAAGHPVVATLPPSDAPRAPLEALGDAWVAGVTIDWQRFRAGEPRRRVTLPTYSFDREHYWIEAVDAPIAPPEAAATAPPAHSDDRTPPPIEPDDEPVRTLLACFREVLGHHRFGAHDDFFARGGDSLLALRLAATIGRRLATKVPIKTIVEARTVTALARRLGAPAPSAERTARSLVLLQDAPGTTPIFLIHGGGGHALVYLELARAIDPGRTVYGIAASGLEPDEPLHTSVEDMARHYIDLARAVHPDGPYLLGGSSLGGTIAYEMARQLTARGHAVPLCAMLDAPGPSSLPATGVAVDVADHLAFHLDTRRWLSIEQLRGRPLDGRGLPPAGSEAEWPSGSIDDQLQRVLDAAHAAGATLPFADLAEGRRLIEVWLNNARVLQAYTAPPWPDGEAQYFAAGERDPRVPHHLERAWIGRCALRVEVSPGDHLSMVRAPHAAVLGAQIRRFLETRTRSIPV